MNILEQWRSARHHPVAALLGALLGGFVPLAAYRTVHYDITMTQPRDLLHPLVAVVAACLLFSVRTVWQWGRAAFAERMKAACLVVAIEGMMVCSPTPWLAQLALLYLICINAVATACILAQDDQPAQQPTVTSVARELNVPRKAAARVVDQRLGSSKPAARAAAT